jgi:hypothetical protein
MVKKIENSYNQALTNFSYADFIFKDFCHNKFPKFVMKKYNGEILRIYCDKKNL